MLTSRNRGPGRPPERKRESSKQRARKFLSAGRIDSLHAGRGDVVVGGWQYRDPTDPRHGGSCCCTHVLYVAMMMFVVSVGGGRSTRAWTLVRVRVSRGTWPKPSRFVSFSLARTISDPHHLWRRRHHRDVCEIRMRPFARPSHLRRGIAHHDG